MSKKLPSFRARPTQLWVLIATDAERASELIAERHRDGSNPIYSPESLRSKGGLTIPLRRPDEDVADLLVYINAGTETVRDLAGTVAHEAVHVAHEAASDAHHEPVMGDEFVAYLASDAVTSIWPAAIAAWADARAVKEGK